MPPENVTTTPGATAAAPGVVLIVDDMPFVIRTLTRFLRADGHVIRTAPDGATALAEAIAAHPDVVLLDIMLPVLDGYEVCRRLRSHPETRDIGIVMITALQTPESRQRGADAGADEFLTKPLKAATVRTVVRTLIDRRRRQGSTVAPPADGRATA